MEKRETILVRLPKGMKGQIKEKVGKGPIPTMNQFIVEACSEKLARTLY